MTPEKLHDELFLSPPTTFRIPISLARLTERATAKKVYKIDARNKQYE